LPRIPAVKKASDLEPSPREKGIGHTVMSAIGAKQTLLGLGQNDRFGEKRSFRIVPHGYVIAGAPTER